MVSVAGLVGFPGWRRSEYRRPSSLTPSSAPLDEPVVTQKTSFGLLGLNAPSSGRMNVIAPAASLAASSCASVRAPASGISIQSPVTEPLVNVRSLFRVGSWERK